MYRFTETTKWKDAWFIDLSIISKVLFIYLIENCDNAGFIEVNKKLFAFLLNVSIDDITKSLNELRKSYIVSKDKRYLWMKNFLFYQKNLPLNPENNAHKQIINIINIHKENFEDIKVEILGAKKDTFSPIGKGIGIDKGIDKGIGKGKVNGIGLDFGENTETINLIWRKVYKTLPAVVEADFLNELLEKFGAEKTELIIKNFRSNGFNNISTMRRSLDDEGNIKPKNESQDNHKGYSYEEAIIQNKGQFTGWDKKEDGLWYKN